MAIKTDERGFSRTHDGQLVYPVGHELPSWATGWVQCDNNGAGYATWLEPEDQIKSRADNARIEAEAAKLRTRAQCVAALAELGLNPSERCSDMRTSYIVHSMRDLWPLRQVAPKESK